MNIPTDPASRSPFGWSPLANMRPLVLAAALPLLAACGNDPPISCGSIDDIELTVGSTQTITPCFEDPEMEAITLSAESSDAAVAQATVSGARVLVRAHSIGSATMSITASDPQMQTASLSFGVEVPNQAPRVRAPLPDRQITPGGSLTWALSSYFEEPDGQNLTYSVGLSQQGIVTVSVSADIATITASGEGAVTVTVTATDPMGLSAEQQATITVAPRPRLIEDEFDTEESLADWTVNSVSEAAVEEGMYHLHVVESGFVGWATADMSAIDWRVTASMGNATDSAWVALTVGANHSRFSLYHIQIGADDNAFGLGETDYRFLIYDADNSQFGIDDDWYGQSSEIGGIGELTEVTIAVEEEVLTVSVGQTELVRIDFEGTVLSPEATFLALSVWPRGNSTDKTVFFDWVWAEGFDPDGDAMTAAGRVTPGPAEVLPADVGVKRISKDIKDLLARKPVPARTKRRE